MRSNEQGWRQSFAPLAVPTVVIADDPELLASTRTAYADWLAEAPLADPVFELSLVVGDAPFEEVDCGIRVEGSRLTLIGDGICGWADAGTGRAHCVVPRRLAGDPASLADEVTDTLLLFLLARAGRTPVHATGILIGKTVLVLAGASGSGKSRLALAAARRGLRLLSDDILFVQLEPALRVWGLARPLHVFPEDALPDEVHGSRSRGGKLKASVPIPAGTRASVADRAILILLEPGESLALTPIRGDDAVRQLAKLEPGFDLLSEQSALAARALTRGGAWRLTRTQDPDAAIDLLCDRFGVQRRAG